MKEIGQSGITAEVSSTVQDQISWLVEATADNTYQIYNSERTWMSQNILHFAQADMSHCINLLVAEVGHNAETILEAYVKYMAENDPLFHTIPGRLIRHIKPSEKRKQLNQICSLAQKNNKDIAKRLRDEMIRKYRP